MAACGAQACAEEKVDTPKRLFNYKPAGKKSANYGPILEEGKYDNVDEFVAVVRKSMENITEVMKMPILVDAMDKTITTELIVEKGKVSDADITVYMNRPKALPKKGCPAIVFVHGGAAVAGSARDLNPGVALAALYYGVVGFNVEYRLAPEHRNKGGADVYAALRYVYDNAEKLGIDKSRIGMEGQGAGSHHIFNAMNIMAQKGEQGLCKMIISDIGMFTSVLRFSSAKEWKGEEVAAGDSLNVMYQAMLGDKYQEKVNNKDPMLFPELVEEDKLKFYPPVAFFSAEFSSMHKGNQFFAQRLEEMGKLLEFRLIPGYGHMYHMAKNDDTNAVYADRVRCVNVYLKN